MCKFIYTLGLDSFDYVFTCGVHDQLVMNINYLYCWIYLILVMLMARPSGKTPEINSTWGRESRGWTPRLLLACFVVEEHRNLRFLITLFRWFICHTLHWREVGYQKEATLKSLFPHYFILMVYLPYVRLARGGLPEGGDVKISASDDDDGHDELGWQWPPQQCCTRSPCYPSSTIRTAQSFCSRVHRQVGHTVPWHQQPRPW